MPRRGCRIQSGFQPREFPKFALTRRYIVAPCGQNTRSSGLEVLKGRQLTWINTTNLREITPNSCVTLILDLPWAQFSGPFSAAHTALNTYYARVAVCGSANRRQRTSCLKVFQRTSGSSPVYAVPGPRGVGATRRGRFAYRPSSRMTKCVS